MKHNYFIRSLACFLVSAFISTSSLAANHDALTDNQKAEVKSIIHHYFIDNPDALMDAFKSLQSYQMKQQQKQAQSKIAMNAQQVFLSPSSPVMGNDKGDVTLVEFLDYRCGHCREMVEVVKKQMSLDENLRVVIKQLPIFGGQSLYAAKAALAAARQDKFQPLHEALLSTKLSLTKKNVLALAKKAGINTTKLKKDMNDKALMEEITANMKLARTLGIGGTPALIIGHNKGTPAIYLPGAVSLETLQKSVDDIRKAPGN